MITFKVFKKFISPDNLIFYTTIFNLILATLMMFSVALSAPKLPKQLPLFYSLPWGETQLVDISQFIILPFMAILITLINLAISWHLHESQIVLKRMLSIGSAAITLLILITTLRIISIFT
ncbi:MAG: hypothetical protein ACHQVK_00425 [Candidatus Paceibacterales bacterium]